MSEITLLALDHAAAASLASDPAAFAGRHALALAPHEPTVVAMAVNTAHMLAAGGGRTQWGGYLAVEGPQRRVVGACGFKGGPGGDGAVEIAYFTFPGEEGRGIATAMVAALVDVARAGGSEVAVVRAHTLPERNASCRALEKAGFLHAGHVTDPEDGPVWRWERPVRAPRSDAPAV
jgi:RimJ/RimL family protein N-acetyltransferase